MKLNLTREQVSLPIYSVTPHYAKRIQADWLTLEAECKRRGELIEQLSHALMNESENTTTRKLTVTELALSAVEEWRQNE